MATPQLTNPQERLRDVQADVSRNRELLEQSRRRRLLLESRLRESGETIRRHRRRGLLGFFRP